MEWVEIPAQRLLLVSNEELCRFETRGDPGEHKLYVRPDGRVFRFARVQPAEAQVVALCYLEPV